MNRWIAFVPIGIIVLFSLFLFRNYFVKGLVPFPANLLVATYEPWRSYPVPEYPNGPPNKPMGFDNIRIYFPLKKVAIETIKKFQPPLWNPYNFTGNPILATYQSAIFHPLSFLYLLLPQIDAWSIVILLQPILAFSAMYIFLSVLDLSVWAKLLGSLTYALSGFFMVWWEEAYMFTYSALFLPLALSAIELFLKHRKHIYLAALSLCLAGSIVSGAFQMTFYVFVFCIIWITYRIRQIGRIGAIGLIEKFSLSFATAILLSSIHLIPSMEAYYYSARISTDAKYIFDAYLLPVWQLVTMVAPDYFGNPGTYNYFGSGFYHERMLWIGIVPLILVLTQFVHPYKTKHSLFFRYAFLISLSLALSLPTSWLLLYYLKLPLLSTMTPSRIVMLMSFCAAVLTAFGVESYREKFSLRTIVIACGSIWIVTIIGIAYALCVHYLIPKNVTYMISLRNLVIPFATLGIMTITLFLPQKKNGLFILVLLMLGNSYLFAQKFLYFSERRFLYPEPAILTQLKKLSGYNRFWTYENGYMEKNFATYYGLFSPEGYDSITIRRYAEFLSFANSRGKSINPDRANALIQSTDHLNTILTDTYRRKVLELLGVRYILQKLVPDRSEPRLLTDPTTLPRVWDDGTYAIHEFPSAFPRVFLTSDYEIVLDGKMLLTRLFSGETDMRRTIFLEEEPKKFSVSSRTGGTADITSYTPNTVSIQVQAGGNMLLFLSDAYYPGWNAYVDGAKTPVYRADYAFRAVTVPKGNHSVVFKYEPWSWKAGIIGSVLGILTCTMLAITKRKK